MTQNTQPFSPRKGRPPKNPDRISAFAHNLNVIKTEKGITNQMIADFFGFKYVSQVSYWTAGHGMPTTENLQLLAELLQVKVSELTEQKLMVVMKQQGVV